MSDRRPAFRLTALASALHFLVDGMCICCLYLMADTFSTARLVAVFMTYNVLAFLSQPLTGWLADRLRCRHLLLFVAVAALSLALLWSGVVASVAGLGQWGGALLVLASLLGIGNSLFHVWGGKETAVNTGNDIRALGVFVATGAMGLAVGRLLFSWPLLIGMLLAVCLLSVSYIYIDVRAAQDCPSAGSAAASAAPFRWPWATLLVLLIMTAVMLRSFVGEVFAAGLPRGALMVIVVGATAMLGKMAGGWLARWLGIVRVLAVLVAVVAVCALLRSQHEAIALTGLFAVNCTMPVTLYLANVVLPGREGLAFGLLAAALMPGYLL